MVHAGVRNPGGLWNGGFLVSDTLTQRLQSAVALRDAATAGEWHVSPRKHQQNQIVESAEIGPEDSRNRSIATVWKRDGFKDARPNAAFIAAAPSIVQLAVELGAECEALRADAERYRWLRERDLETISKGGVFAGMTPKNVVINLEDLDAAIDAAMTKESPNAQ